VEIQIGRERRRDVARVVEPSDESYERLWKVADANNRHRYSAYQEKATLPIAVVAIRPS
jgi:hypothetical protein